MSSPHISLTWDRKCDRQWMYMYVQLYIYNRNTMTKQAYKCAGVHYTCSLSVA